MKNHRVRLLAAPLVLFALVFATVACASSRSRSESRSSASADFSAVQTGSYIPRVRPKSEPSRAAKSKLAKAKRQKRAANTAEKKPAASDRADDDYVPRGGFR